MSKTDKKKIVRAERGQMKGWKGKNKRWYIVEPNHIPRYKS